MRTWAFVLTKLALALDQDPDSWVKLAGIELPTSELKEIKAAARRTIAPSSRSETDTLAKLRTELQTTRAS